MRLKLNLLFCFATLIICAPSLADITWYFDGDGDGWGDPSNTITTTDATEPFGYTALGGDCDDVDPNIRIGAGDIADFIDNDCDGFIDEGVQPPTSLSPNPLNNLTGVFFGSFIVPVNTNFNLSIQAGSPVTFSPIMPSGMTFSGSGVDGMFDWTPNSTDLGFHKAEAYFASPNSGVGQGNGGYAIIQVVPEPTSGLVLTLTTLVLLRRRP